jgi:periplasmic divalent cation tolerance protein
MSEQQVSFQLVLVSTGSEAQALQIGRELVERRLAACVNIVRSVCSVYRWEGKIVEEGEALLLIKSRREQFEAVRAAVRELHSYDTPEVLAFPIEAGDSNYLAWLKSETANSEP